MSLQSREDDESILSNAPGYKLFSSEDPEGQAPFCNKWKSKLLSASFWNKMIVISCVIAVSLDPLFFYIPIIDGNNKCLKMDQNLRIVALILRSLTDITFLVHIGYQIWEALNKAYKGINKGKSEMQLDWQTTLIRRDEIIPFAEVFAGKLSWSSLLIDLLSVSICQEFVELSYHLRKLKGLLEYGSKPYSICFFTFLRATNFGTNLVTSSDVWENLFAVLISITGLLLFVHLIGNVQTFLQMRTIKSEEIRQKIKLKKQVVEAWMAKNDIPDDMKKEIMKNINKNLEDDKDVDIENVFNVLPWRTKKCLKRVQLLQEMDDKVLKMMCDYMTPVTYPEDKIIFGSGNPIDRMLLIIEGTLLIYNTPPDPSLTQGGETTNESGSTATKQVETGGVVWRRASDVGIGPAQRIGSVAEASNLHRKCEMSNKSRSLCSLSQGLEKCSIQMQTWVEITQ